MDFIETYQIDNDELMDLIIDWFERNPTKTVGKSGIKGIYNPEFKDSVDCALKGPLFDEYVKHLGVCLNRYKEKYPLCSNIVSQWSLCPAVNVQRYMPGGGYKILHCERESNSGECQHRHLVFMTYLNDVTDQGETFFYHQKLKIQPVKGRTVIWPVDWTHAHCGIPSQSQIKYIVTGWFNYV